MPSGSIANSVVFHTSRRYSAARIPAAFWNRREPTTRFTHDIAVTAPSALDALVRFRIEQSMEVNDEIAHVGVVDVLLRLGLPGNVGGGVVRINADNVQFIEIPELDLVQIGEFATEYEVKQLSARGLIRHGSVPHHCRRSG